MNEKHSGVKFIFDNTFNIESYKDKYAFSSVEFIRAKGNRLIFIEAKPSFAKSDDDPSAQSPGAFKTDIDEICNKFIQSLNLYLAIKVGYIEIQLPKDFYTFGKAMLQFVLVMNADEKWCDGDWCRGMEAKIYNALPQYWKKTWRPEVKVMNYTIAIKKKLAEEIQEGNVNG